MVDCNIFGGPLLPMLRFRDVALGVVDNFYLCIREVSLPTNLCGFMLRQAPIHGRCHARQLLRRVHMLEKILILRRQRQWTIGQARIDSVDECARA